MSDEETFDIYDDNTEYSNTNSDLNKAEPQDVKEQSLGSIFTTEQCNTIKLINCTKTCDVQMKYLQKLLHEQKKSFKMDMI